METEPDVDQVPKKGQTYNDFLRIKGNQVTKYNNVFYIQPLEEFPTPFLINLGNYLEAFFFPMKVKILKPQEIRKMKVRTTMNEETGKIQYHGKDIVSRMESRMLKLKNVFAMVCLMRSDMAPNFDYKYSYGYCKSNPKISVFSIARFTNTFTIDDKILSRMSLHDLNKATNWHKVLYESCRIITHELSHELQLQHCIFFKCLMNQYKNVAELLEKPMTFCPICLRKFQKVLGFKLIERYYVMY